MPVFEYAKALFEQAKESKNLDAVYQNTKVIEESLVDNKDFTKTLNVPVLNDSEKIKIIDKVFSKCEKPLLQLMYVLAKNKRFDLLEKILVEFENLYLEETKKVIVTVSSSTELSSSETQKLEKDLEKKLSKSVVLIEKIDESLIGGIKLDYSGKTVDASYKEQLKKLKGFL